MNNDNQPTWNPQPASNQSPNPNNAPAWSDVPQQQSQQEIHQTWRFGFKGNGTEYFKIWISNLFLIIITLTLYAPWAKVRRLRYFYGNTYLKNRKFDFTGIPSRILIGRLIALGAYGIFVASGYVSLELNAILTIAFLLLIPWLIRSSTRFHARNSKYENSRFHFSANMKRTYLVAIGCWLITVFSLGLLFPIALLWFKRYQLDHLYIGQLKFRLTADAGDFFAAVMLPMLMFMGAILGAGVLVAVGYFAGIAPELMMILAAGLYLLAVFFLAPLIQGYLFKATWSHVQIGNSQMKTDVSPWKFAWIQMTNSFAILFSVGLMYAWAQVRIYRYKIESLSVVFYDDPSELMNKAQEDYNAIGEELADIFDIDISL